jgi:hypothetical protein
MAGEVEVREEGTEGGLSTDTLLDGMEGAVQINYGVEYAMYVEFPTSYTTGPPYSVIREWVDRKWNDLSGGIKTDADGEPQSKDTVAWKIRNAINENGQRGVHFGGRSLNRMERNADAVMAQYAGSGDPEAPQKALAALANGGFAMSQRIISQEATDTGSLLQSGSIAFFEDPAAAPDGAPDAESDDRLGDGQVTDA